MVVETRARGRGADSPSRRGMSAVAPCQSGSGRLARPGGRKQVLGRLIIYIPVERASQIRQLLARGAGRVSAGRDRAMDSVPIYLQSSEPRKWTPYVTNPSDCRHTARRVRRSVIWRAKRRMRAEQDREATVGRTPTAFALATHILLSCGGGRTHQSWADGTGHIREYR